MQISLMPSMAKKINHIFIKTLGLYILVALVFGNLTGTSSQSHRSQHKKTPTPLEHSAQSKALGITFEMQQRNLALNYIGNVKKLSFGETQAFQSAGLAHLLAISGGQIGSVLFALEVLFFSPFSFFKKKLCPIRLNRTMAILKPAFGISISLFISSVFGNSGSLMRVSFLSFLSRFPQIKSLSVTLSKFSSLVSPFTWGRIVVLGCILIFSENPFVSYSFLLSAMGAQIAGLASDFSSLIMRSQNHNSSWLAKFWKSIVATFLCSGAMALLLSPFSQTQIISSMFANVFALPLTNLAITPLSLFALILPEHSVLLKPTLQGLDSCLSLLLKIAQAFASDASKNPFAPSALFSEEGRLYLIASNIFLWSFSDYSKLRYKRNLRKSFYGI